MTTKYKTIVVPSTAGTIDFLYSPGKEMKAKILYGYIEVTNDATVANRVLNIKITDKDGNQIASTLGTSNITASQNKWVVFWGGNPQGDLSDQAVQLLSGQINMMIPIPVPYIYETDIMRVILSSGQAGDTIEGRFKILEAPTNEDFHP